MADQTGRNDPCPCGSGKKFKKCHLGKNDSIMKARRAPLVAIVVVVFALVVAGFLKTEKSKEEHMPVPIPISYQGSRAQFVEDLIASYPDKEDAKAFGAAISSHQLDVFFERVDAEAQFAGVHEVTRRPTLIISPDLLNHPGQEHLIQHALFHEYRHYQQFLSGLYPREFYERTDNTPEHTALLMELEVDAHFRECSNAIRFWSGEGSLLCEALRDRGKVALIDRIAQDFIDALPRKIPGVTPDTLIAFQFAIAERRDALIRAAPQK